MNKASLAIAISDHARGDNAGLWGAIGGRFYFARAPQATEPPYVVFHFIDGSIIPTFNYDDRTEETRVQFTVFSEEKSAVEIMDIFDLLTTRFDRAEFTYRSSDFVHQAFRRQSDNLFRLTSPTEDVWQYIVDYLYWVTPPD